MSETQRWFCSARRSTTDYSVVSVINCVLYLTLVTLNYRLSKVTKAVVYQVSQLSPGLHRLQNLWATTKETLYVSMWQPNYLQSAQRTDVLCQQTTKTDGHYGACVVSTCTCCSSGQLVHYKWSADGRPVYLTTGSQHYTLLWSTKDVCPCAFEL